jgi:hypothetical protein
MKRMRYVFALLALGVCLAGVSGDDSDRGLKALMQQKLKASQQVLEGIATNDFGKISDNAHELIRISKAAEWRVVKTPLYQVHSDEFRRNAENLIQMAKEKNLDGATLAYVDMTLNCVKCHKYVRQVRMTRLDP